ncbi:MAG: hypothetical protein ABJA79_05145 [Parafilimonas sp.]
MKDKKINFSCAGYFLLWQTIKDGITEIRKHTGYGNININTNALYLLQLMNCANEIDFAPST